MVLDDENRENEGDMVFVAETMTTEQMAMSFVMAVVCVCLYYRRAPSTTRFTYDGRK